MAKEIIRVLLIEDEEFDVRRIQKTVKPFEHRIQIRDVVSSGRQALELIEVHAGQYDVVIMDFQIAGGLMGESLIREIKALDSTLQIIVVTKMTVNMTDFEFAARLLEAGAMWYCTKYPGDIEEFIYQPTDFILSLFNAFEKRKLEKAQIRSNQKLEKSIEEILQKKQLVGESGQMMRLRKIIRQCASTDANVLISGESGTGKELIAANIHYTGDRRMETFLPVNCGSLPENLMESELFGFEKGSFTGAGSHKKGFFELANNGTIFLDEIGELPPQTQSKLLRVIQEGEIDKIGRVRKVKVNVRIIVATNRNLEKEVREKRFREDLYYRLNVVSVTAPSLRDHPDDIPVLVNHFLEWFARDMNRRVPLVDNGAMNVLIEHPWPGNVRELQNVIQRMLITDVEKVDEEEAKLALGHRSLYEEERDSSMRWDKNNIIPWREMERSIRYEYFQFVRQNTRSDADAARKLGLAPPNYHRMCKELGLK